MEKKILGKHEINTILRHTNSEYNTNYLKDFRTGMYRCIPNNYENSVAIELVTDSAKKNNVSQQQTLDM